MCFSASIIIPFFRSKDSTCVFFCVFFGDRRWHIQWSSFSKHPMQRKHSHPDSRFLQCLSICTHPNQYSSCKTYFTEMALSRGVKKLKEKDLSIIHWYRWLLWCEGVLMERDAPCVSLRFVMLLSSSSLTKHNHWSGICESLWILISRFWINHRFIYLCIFLSLCVSLWLPKHPLTGEPQQHPS